MSTRTELAILETHRIARRIAAGATQALEVVAVVVVFSVIGALLAWRG